MKHHSKVTGQGIAKAAGRLWKKLEPDVWKNKKGAIKDVEEMRALTPEKDKKLEEKERKRKQYKEENFIKVKWPKKTGSLVSMTIPERVE